MRVASIDIGTNSVLATVAELSDDGTLRPVWQGISEPRLGEGLSISGKISPDALRRTASAIETLVESARAMGAESMVAFGTQALRSASNGEAATNALSRAAGMQIELLDPSEEARLAFIGATADLHSAERNIVVDIGGGSTEIAWGRSRPERFVSLPIGAVTLSESCHAQPPLSEAARSALRKRIDEELRNIPNDAIADRIVGVGGTITTLATLFLELESYLPERVHGSIIPTKWMRSTMEWFEKRSIDEIAARIPFAKKRAAILPAGTAIALALLDHMKSNNIVASDHGARWGMLITRFGNRSAK
ncbi:rod shape-determining protein [bacterium]|nr:rod shape-determining protein [bacterium]